MTDQVNLANIHLQFNRLHVALHHAAQITNDPEFKRWADQIDEAHQEFYEETHNNYATHRES